MQSKPSFQMNKSDSAAVMRRDQKGVALITILVVVALLSMVAVDITNGWVLNKRRTQNIIYSDQAYLYVLSAEELASQLLIEALQAEGNKNRVDLSQPWTEAFMFPLDNGMIQGQITDAQSCFNLNSILHNVPAQNNNERDQGSPVSGDQKSGSSSGDVVDNNNDAQQDPRKPTSGQKLFQQMLYLILTPELVNTIPSGNVESLAAAVRDWVDPDNTENGLYGAEDYAYTGMTIPYRASNNFFASKTELRLIKGFNEDIYRAIKDYVCVIPEDGSGQTSFDEPSINVNTIPSNQPELLAMLYSGQQRSMSVSDAQQIFTDRDEDPENFDEQNLKDYELNEDAQGRVQFSSEYFILEASAQIEDRSSKIVSLLRRENDRFTVVNRHFGEQ